MYIYVLLNRSVLYQLVFVFVFLWEHIWCDTQGLCLACTQGSLRAYFGLYVVAGLGTWVSCAKSSALLSV